MKRREKREKREERKEEGVGRGESLWRSIREKIHFFVKVAFSVCWFCRQEKTSMKVTSWATYSRLTFAH